MSKKNNNRVVYSTNSNFNYEEDDDELETIANNEQKLTVFIDRKQRKGKSVTIVSGFIGTNEDAKGLAKELKLKCGVGGSVKENEIMIQGEFKEKVYDLLIKMGYDKTKKSGG